MELSNLSITNQPLLGFATLPLQIKEKESKRAVNVLFCSSSMADRACRDLTLLTVRLWVCRTALHGGVSGSDPPVAVHIIPSYCLHREARV